MSDDLMFPPSVEELAAWRREAEAVLAYTHHPDGSKAHEGRAVMLARRWVRTLNELERLTGGVA